LRSYFEKDDRFLLEYLKNYLVAFGCNPEQAQAMAAEVNRITVSEFDPEDCVPADVFETLDYLKMQEFRLAIVTNRHEPCYEQLEKLGLLPYFESIVIAGDINRWKPEAEIFNYALEQLGIDASEALYVGDNYYSDIIGAQRVGLSPVLIDPEGIFPDAKCRVINQLGDLIELDYKDIQ